RGFRPLRRRRPRLARLLRREPGDRPRAWRGRPRGRRSARRPLPAIGEDGVVRTRVCDMFGIEVPIFAFSHCRDVVAAVSKAGGLGVLGAATITPEELELELEWLDA